VREVDNCIIQINGRSVPVRQILLDECAIQPGSMEKQNGKSRYVFAGLSTAVAMRKSLNTSSIGCS